MSDLIKQFYIDNNIPLELLHGKMQMFERNPDIAKEYEYWIKRGKYQNNGNVCIDGYTAEKLSKISKYLEGEGSFIMLIKLRENPKQALAELSRGFKRK